MNENIVPVYIVFYTVAPIETMNEKTVTTNQALTAALQDIERTLKNGGYAVVTMYNHSVTIHTLEELQTIQKR